MSDNDDGYAMRVAQEDEEENTEVNGQNKGDKRIVREDEDNLMNKPDNSRGYEFIEDGTGIDGQGSSYSTVEHDEEHVGTNSEEERTERTCRPEISYDKVNFEGGKNVKYCKIVGEENGEQEQLAAEDGGEKAEKGYGKVDNDDELRLVQVLGVVF